MSMLTPPGMGGKYRVTGDVHPRMGRPRHRRRIVLAVLGAMAVLGLAGWGTLQLIDVFSGRAGTAEVARKTDCKPRKPAVPAGAQQLPKPGDITVNVLNATPRSGLAKSTADELRKRGFKIGNVGNAPANYDKKVKGTGVLVGAPGALDASLKVVGTQLAGAPAEADQRTGTDVDLIIGDGFQNLTEQKDADKALTALVNPSPAPSAPGC
ncbi:LytR C-terminal domain-containing protein [Streptomyces sp. URMC 123]|uniref:LytR C-terminal domain-containing protein n=1 Tax=Streptomyces sp. URMC 123 TaxID=3423403 RepID=UPI003F1AC56A